MLFFMSVKCLGYMMSSVAWVVRVINFAIYRVDNYFFHFRLWRKVTSHWVERLFTSFQRQKTQIQLRSSAHALVGKVRSCKDWRDVNYTNQPTLLQPAFSPLKTFMFCPKDKNKVKIFLLIWKRIVLSTIRLLYHNILGRHISDWSFDVH